MAARILPKSFLTPVYRFPNLNLRSVRSCPRISLLLQSRPVLRPAHSQAPILPRRVIQEHGLASFHSASPALAPSDSPSPSPKPPPDDQSKKPPSEPPTIHENIYTLPNLLTASRILACPVLGWSILQGDYVLATGLLAYAGITDWVDGYVARKYSMSSVLGTILDPAADKALMTTLTITLAMKGLLPVPLAVIILGRDVLLSISAFWWRYTSLPPPKTFMRYWDFSIPSAEVQPTEVSKINTALQLLLMGVTTVSPLLSFDISTPLRILQYTVAGTTIWSGLGYLFANNSVRIVSKPPKRP